MIRIVPLCRGIRNIPRTDTVLVFEYLMFETALISIH